MSYVLPGQGDQAGGDGLREVLPEPVGLWGAAVGRDA